MSLSLPAVIFGAVAPLPPPAVADRLVLRIKVARAAPGAAAFAIPFCDAADAAVAGAALAAVVAGAPLVAVPAAADAGVPPPAGDAPIPPTPPPTVAPTAPAPLPIATAPPAAPIPGDDPPPAAEPLPDCASSVGALDSGCSHAATRCSLRSSTSKACSDRYICRLTQARRGSAG